MRGFDGLGDLFAQRQARSAAEPAGSPPPDPDTRAGLFIRDIVAVCRHHRLTLRADGGAALTVEALNDPDLHQIRDAYVGPSIDH